MLFGSKKHKSLIAFTDLLIGLLGSIDMGSRRKFISYQVGKLLFEINLQFGIRLRKSVEQNLPQYLRPDLAFWVKIRTA